MQLCNNANIMPVLECSIFNGLLVVGIFCCHFDKSLWQCFC